MSNKTLDVVFTPHTVRENSWLDKQKIIHANEQRFFDMLIRNGYTEAACIYTLHMSNPPALEEVMTVTGLGKTTIYNKLKILRAIEKTDSPDYYVSMNQILAVMSSGFLVLDALESVIDTIREVAKTVDPEEALSVNKECDQLALKLSSAREKERQLDIKFNTMTDEVFNKAKDGMTAKVLLNGKDAEDLRSYKSMLGKIKARK